MLSSHAFLGLNNSTILQFKHRNHIYIQMLWSLERCDYDETNEIGTNWQTISQIQSTRFRSEQKKLKQPKNIQ